MFYYTSQRKFVHILFGRVQILYFLKYILNSLFGKIKNNEALNVPNSKKAEAESLWDILASFHASCRVPKDVKGVDVIFPRLNY